MPFTDEQPFLDAISARYAEDGPRLVYADFLDDAGDPARAELVRVQLALARMPDDHSRKPELVDRQDELIGANSARWTEYLGDLVVSGEFRRGILDSVVVSAETFLARGEELFRRARVRRVRVLEAAALMPKLILSPLLAEVRELDLCSSELGNNGVSLLLRSPFLQNIEDLNLADTGMDDMGLELLSRSSRLPSLQTLAINDNEQITSVGIASLADSPFYGDLKVLDLARNDVSEVGLQAIVASRSLTRLHQLQLTGNPIGDAGIRLLVDSDLLVRMLGHSPRLELRGVGLGPAGAAALGSSPVLAPCTTLDLTANYLGDEGFAALVNSQNLSRLHTLKLGSNQISDAALVAVRAALPGLFSRLRLFVLSGNRLTRYGLGLLESARGESSTILDVCSNIQTTSGGEAPVQVGKIVPDVLRGVTEVAAAAELRRRVAHPTLRRGDRPNPTS